jgi:uncharacterized protein YjbJ (UPF0337 family)
MAGTEEHAEGTWDKAKGKVKEGVGDMTDNKDLEAEGKSDQTKGKMKEAWGDAKDAADEVKDGVKDALDR